MPMFGRTIIYRCWIFRSLGTGRVDLLWRQSAHTMSIGIPIKILHEAEGHIITVETNEGEVYRGKLVEAEDNMNSQLVQVSVTHRDGRLVSTVNHFLSCRVICVTDQHRILVEVHEKRLRTTLFAASVLFN